MTLPTIPRRIDVHHHLIPPAFVARMEGLGIREVAGAPLPKWTPQQSIDVMDDNDIEVAILSLSAPGVAFGDRAAAVSLARKCNEFAADTRQRHPGRFGFFAVLPMPYTEQACAEALHALDVLRADGVVLLGSTDGHFLGSPRFDELMSELDRRSAIVFVHPNLHASSVSLELDLPGFFVEFLCDTTRAATNLILQGSIERFPNIRWILAHAGGFLPYVAWRLSLSNLMRPYADRAPQGFLTYVRRFWFDTALSPSPFAIAALQQLVDPTQILFGSDFPFAPAPVVAMETRSLSSLQVIGDDVRRQIDRENALSLFPRLAGAQALGSVPPRRSELRTQLGRLARRPVVALVEYLRNR